MPRTISHTLTTAREALKLATYRRKSISFNALERMPAMMEEVRALAVVEALEALDSGDLETAAEHFADARAYERAARRWVLRNQAQVAEAVA